MGRHIIDRTGQIYKTTRCGDCEIIKYVNSGNVTIKFLNTGFITKSSIGNLSKGDVKDPYFPIVQGIGFFGEGSNSQIKNHIEYNLWYKCLQRAYDNLRKIKFKTYALCTVEKRWHNFQNFCEDIRSFENWNTKDFCMDKDLRVLGNKKYSRRYVSFVPQEINKILNKHNSVKSIQGMPLGVRKCDNGRFEAQLNINGINTHIGTFYSISKAQSAYCNARVKYVKQTAEKYKGVLHEEVYATLRNISPEYFMFK